MDNFSPQNPHGSLLSLINAYSEKNPKKRKKGIIDWLKNQSPSLDESSLLKIAEVISLSADYAKFS